jgi:pyruvate dehydrogenase E1 component alpha subunit
MNMAAILKAPMVFVCENNGYGEWSSAASTTSVTDIVDRAASYGIAGAMVDGMDIAAVHEASIEAIARARSGAGPTLLECKTYRYYDHVGRDFGMLERDPDEIARWRARDPIKQWRKVLIAQGVFDDNTADTITARIAADMDRAIANAEQAPDPHPDALYEDVYSESTV